jgi:NADH:ubiquinone oxidoreductase subunit 6 (subunit J)
VLAVLEQTLEHALQILPNMLAVLVAALLSVVAVSFFRGETTVFTTTYQLVIFVAAVLSPYLVLVGSIAIVARAHRRQHWDQRELAVLFTLLFFALAYHYKLVEIPELTVVS